jgi:putative spermidine/putrescine transport system permease protein
VPRTLPFLLALLPAAAFIGLFFLAPVFVFLSQGVLKDDVGHTMSRTFHQFSLEKDVAQPTDAALEAFFTDMRTSSRPDIGALAREMDSAMPGLRSMILKASTGSRRMSSPPADMRGWFREQDPRWLDGGTWAALKAQRTRLTWRYLSDTAPWGGADSSTGIQFPEIFLRTIGVALGVAVLCLVTAAPTAYLLVTASSLVARIVGACVLISLWTSILARTLSWIIIFQREGLINAAAQTLPIFGGPYEILGTRTAVVVGMVHVLLPYMIFSLADGLKKIPLEQYRAATSLGASATKAVSLVYLPQLWPAISAGLTIVFTLTVGFYLTPLLLGGPRDQLLGYYTAFFAQRSGDWHAAAALSIWLILLVAGVGLVVALAGRLRQWIRLGRYA